MTKIGLAGRVLLGTAVLAAVLLPAAAVAGPGSAGGGRPRWSLRLVPPFAAVKHAGARGAVASANRANGQAKGQPDANLNKRITNVLAARKRRFDAASAAISARINRLSALMAKVELAGADVSRVEADLAGARGSLAQAEALEASAADAFKALPGSANRRAAFTSAKKSGSGAVAELKIARVQVVLAIRDLRAAIKTIEGETSETP